jgi:hypothetical protein
MNCLRQLVPALTCIAVLAVSGYGGELPLDTSRFGNRSFGFYLGVAGSNFSSGESNWINCYGPDFGSTATMNLTDLLALQGELAYISKGTKWEELLYRDGSFVQSSGNFRIGYLQLAVLARLNQPLSRYRDENLFRPKLLAGFGWSTRVYSSASGVELPDFRRTDFSFIFGGGFDHRVALRRFLTVDVRFDVGLRTVFEDCSNHTIRFLLGMTL